MASQVSSVAAILFSTAFFLIGNGLIGTLTPLRANIEGFSSFAVGALGTWYYAGFVAGCFTGPYLMGRVGHIRTFAVAGAVTAASVLLQPMAPAVFVWFILRCLSGFCIAMLYMSVESWLNDRAGNETRGGILSLYMTVNWLSLIAGQWFLPLAMPDSFQLFSIAAVLYCICLVPLGLTRLPAPQLPAAPRLNVRRIFQVAPVGAAGCLTVGLANGAFWTLGPLYAQSLGFSTGGLALFMSVFILGGALVQWPLGRLSDVIDRRWVITASCVLSSTLGLLLGLLGSYLMSSPVTFFAVVFALGAAMLPLYSLSIAHANDRLPRADFVEVSAGLLMLSSAASIPGPILAATAISTAGSSALFLYTALAQGAMAFYAFTRIMVREPASAETRDPFAPVPQGSPAALPLDPRGAGTNEAR
jgi:MFS family permease